MAHRTFKDSHGRNWDAWTVLPTKVERRVAEQPVDVDRREFSELRVRLGHAMAEGWVCFETSGEKRRLAPIPETWYELSDEELTELCFQAEQAPNPRRLIE